jgi:GT2 family glycosyltransferase
VVTYNGAAVISECLKSIRALRSPPSDVIIVDNASVDNTKEEVAKLFPQALIVSLKVNKGYGSGCNEGARYAKGDVLIFLNQDICLDSAFVNEILSTMESDPKIGVCGGLVLSWDSKYVVSAGQVFDRWTGYGLDNGFGSLWHETPGVAEDVFSPNGAAFAVRRDAFDQIGGFFEDLFLYFDETDLSWRARLAGFRAVCCTKAVVRHSINPERAHNPGSRYYIDRNSLLSAVRNYELSSLVIYLPTSFLVRVIGVVILTLLRRVNHARSTRRALFDFLLLFPKTWKERRSIAATRRLGDRQVMNTHVLATPKDVLRVFSSSLLPYSKRGTKRQ